ncbi:hypothetical protein [Salininema proteolyticum]|uniref:Uncharacterized protein n=1 Tax=Salininema proteolyticum TaxID=1607685 RepID=A0ABV8U4A1_9ACTN
MTSITDPTMRIGTETFKVQVQLPDAVLKPLSTEERHGTATIHTAPLTAALANAINEDNGFELEYSAASDALAILDIDVESQVEEGDTEIVCLAPGGGWPKLAARPID